MPSSSPHLLKLEDFEKYQWIAVLDRVKPAQCESYSGEFVVRANDYQLAGDTTGQEVFSFLSSITSVLMEPLGLKTISKLEGNISSFLSDHQFALLRELVSAITDPEMKARVTDILWICKKRDIEKDRPIQMARIAVESYLQAAKNTEDIRNWMPCYYRIQRAAQLAPSVDGKKSTQMCSLVISHIGELIDRLASVEDEFITGSAMKILQEDLRKSLSVIQTDLHNYAKEYAKIAAKKAIFAENFQDYHKAFYQKKAYRHIESEWYKIANDKESERKVGLQLGEIDVWYAEQALIKNEPNSYATAAGRIEDAIAVFEKVEDTFGRRQDSFERMQELHKQMLAYQKESKSQMSIVRLAKPDDFFDVKMQETARELVKGKSLTEAFYSLAFDYKLIPCIENLEVKAKEEMESYKLLHLIPIAYSDDEGKTKALSGNGEDDLKNTMFRIAKFYQSWYGLNFVVPACEQICSEHPVTLEDLGFVLYENPFIPEGRKPLYAQGLIAGLKGDPVIAAHLLIPQVENSLRYILKQKGCIASKRGTIQDDFLLHEVLNSSDLMSILNEDTIFTLKGLLVERMGSNLRNDLCHGLLDYGRFFTSELPYFWWLTLYLCLVPTYRQWIDGKKKES